MSYPWYNNIVFAQNCASMNSRFEVVEKMLNVKFYHEYDGHEDFAGIWKPKTSFADVCTSAKATKVVCISGVLWYTTQRGVNWPGIMVMAIRWAYPTVNLDHGWWNEFVWSCCMMIDDLSQLIIWASGWSEFDKNWLYCHGCPEPDKQTRWLTCWGVSWIVGGHFGTLGLHLLQMFVDHLILNL